MVFLWHNSEVGGPRILSGSRLPVNLEIFSLRIPSLRVDGSFLVPNRGVVTRVFVGCRVFGCEIRVKVKLVLEDKLKNWSFESENINKLTLPSVLEDVESLFNDQLRNRRLHAKLLYT